MKKRTKIILALLSTLCLSVVAGGCSGGVSQQPAPYEIASGFEIEEEITVMQYAPITPNVPLVVLTNGEPVDILFEVTDSKGAYVEISGGGFIARDRNGYTVRYSALYEGQLLAEKTMKVKVQGSSVGVSAEYEQFIEVGTQVQIKATADTQASFTYTVACNGAPVTVSAEGIFTPQSTGKYEINIVGTDPTGVTGEFSYSTYARRKGMVGEIETFGEDWGELIKTSSISRPGWTRVTTDDISLMYGENQGEGLVDRFGQKSEYIAFTTTGIPEDQTGNSYLNVQVDARYDVKYYEQLANEGYEYVSIWIYMDSQIKHLNYIYTDPSYSSQFHIEGSETDATRAKNPVLKPGQWTELRLGLYDGALGEKDWVRSFISAYPFYKNGTTFIRIDNSEQDNIPYGQEPSKMTIYVAGIFAMRETEKVSVDKAIGENFDVAKAVDKDGTLYVGEGFSYKIFENGEEIPSSQWNNLSMGMHDLQVHVMKDGSLYELRNVELGVINTQQAMSFQEVTTDEAKAYSVQYGTPKSKLTTEIPAGKSETYYKVAYGANENEEPGLKLLPALSKNALQKFAGGSIFFDYYVHGSVAKMDLLATSNNDRYQKNAPFVKDQWSTVYIPVDYLIEHYDEYYNGFVAKSHAGKLISFGNWTNEAGYFYVSEVRVAKDVRPVEVVNATTSLTTEEFTDSYTISAAKIAELGLTGKTLSAELNGVKSTNGTLVAIQGKQDGDVLTYDVYIEHVGLGFRQLAYSEKILIIDNTIVREFVGIQKNNVHSTQYGSAKDGQLSVVSNPEQKTGNYFKVSYNAGENEEPGLKVTPTLAKSVLEKYRGGTLKFDIWVSTEQSTLNILCESLNAQGKAVYLRQETLQQNAWNTITISVEDILRNYDLMVDNFSKATHLGKLFSLEWSSNKKAGTIYYGNFRVEPAAKDFDAEEVPVDYESNW